MMIETPGLPGLDLDGATSLRGNTSLGSLGQINIKTWLEMRGMGGGLGANPEFAANVPSQPGDYYAIAGWVQNYLKPYVKRWWEQVQTELRGRGFTISNVVSTLDSPTESLRINYTMTKKGVSIDDLIQGGNEASSYTPAEYAKRKEDLEWVWKYQYTGAAAQEQQFTGQTTRDRSTSRTGDRTGTTSGTTQQVSLISAPAGSRTDSKGTSPSGSPANQGTQPGEVPADLPATTGQKMAAGAGDEANKNSSESESFFSSSIDISGTKIPVVLLLGAGLLLAFGMGGARKE